MPGDPPRIPLQKGDFQGFTVKQIWTTDYWQKSQVYIVQSKCTTAYEPGQMAGFSEGGWGVTVGAEAVSITSPLGPYTQP